MSGRRLFCTPLCRNIAGLIRYRRRVETDGRIHRDDVKAALAIREAYCLWGQVYERAVTPEIREQVFAAKGRACVLCGAQGTEIDHIESAFYGDHTIDNLQPLCGECHRSKTLDSAIPWDTHSSAAQSAYAARRADYENRWQAPKPLRACDDELRWDTQWRALMFARAVAVRGGVLPAP